MNERTNTTPRPDGATIPAYRRCMVVELADRLRDARDDVRSLDEMLIQNHDHVAGPLEAVARREMSNALDAERIVQDMISCTMAVSLEGAAMQLVEIVPRLEAMQELIVPSNLVDEEHMRATLRLLFSALEVVERHCSVPLSDLVDGGYNMRTLSPWMTLHEHVAARDEACERKARP